MELLPKVLTINNLSLYASNNYLLDNQNNLLLGQLLDFQINHICSNHLSIPTHNEFGFNYPRYKLIEQIIEKNTFQFSECPECILFGLASHNKTDYYSYKNIGGKPLQLFELDDSLNSLKDYSPPIFDANNDEEITLDISIDKRLVIAKEKVVDEKQPAKKKSLLAGLVSKEKTESEKMQERIDLAIQIIQNPKTFYDKLGKIVGQNKSSYSDVILSLLVYSPFYNTNITSVDRNKLNKPFINKYINRTLSNDEYKLFIRNIIQFSSLFDEYHEQIEKGDIITSELFRSSVDSFKKFGGIIVNNYSSNNISYNPAYFYRDILKLYLHNIDRCQRLEKIFLMDEPDHLFDGQEKIPSEIIDNVSIYENNKPNLNILFSLEGKILNNLITRNRNRNIKDEADKIYCSICNEYRSRSDKSHDIFHKKNHITTAELVNNQFDLLGEEVYCKEGYIYKKQDGQILVQPVGNRTEIIGEVEAISRGIIKKYSRAIYNYTLTNAETITFYINRREVRPNPLKTAITSTFYYDIPVIPDNILTDMDNNKYSLNAIITDNDSNYLLFINMNNTWLLYNSLFNTDDNVDFIEEIGSYQNLLDYNNNYVEKYGILYFYHI